MPVVREGEARHALPLAKLYLVHTFDLLGSGWVRVYHGRPCRGLEGRRYPAVPLNAIDPNGEWLRERINEANLARSRSIWSLVDPGYVPIDWQLDFKSGFRWSEATWYRDIPIAHLPGVDIKVPWELSRMQHLPQLALSFGLTHDAAYARECRNQLLDWIATNPPRFGVNWNSTMEAGIRVANWLLAYDLLRAWNAQLDAAFESILARSVYEHGLHIINNLEKHGVVRGNHYLANIAGLLFAASYLPRTQQTDRWLAFAIQELVREAGEQFANDGANFEASICYHRLSAEMVIWATALVLGLPSERRGVLRDSEAAGGGFPPWYLERLQKMAEFTAHATKPSGRVAQIGDNDSGRFFKLTPKLERLTVLQARRRYANLGDYAELPDASAYWVEDHLDHRHLVNAVAALFERQDLAQLGGEHSLDERCIRGFAGETKLPSYLGADRTTTAERIVLGSARAWQQLRREFEGLPAEHRRLTTLLFPGRDLRAGLRLYAYPDFGLYIYRSERAFIALRCGAVGQKGVGGHAHNDQLSLELCVDGCDHLSDPGTYLYTPLPQVRNQYRSVSAHAAPSWQRGEPGDLALGLFELRPSGQPRCIWFDREGFAGSLLGRKNSLHRAVCVETNCVKIEDFSVGCRLSSARPSVLPSNGGATLPPFSPGYGICLRVQGAANE